MSALMIELTGGQTVFTPGQRLTGTIHWELPAQAETMEARLLWFTRGKGTQDVTVVATLPLGRPTMSGSKAFQFDLPDHPYSFSGRLISLVWAVEVVVDDAADSARAEFVLSPWESEVDITAEPTEATS